MWSNDPDYYAFTSGSEKNGVSQHIYHFFLPRLGTLKADLIESQPNVNLFIKIGTVPPNMLKLKPGALPIVGTKPQYPESCNNSCQWKRITAKGDHELDDNLEEEIQSKHQG